MKSADRGQARVVRATAPLRDSLCEPRCKRNSKHVQPCQNSQAPGHGGRYRSNPWPTSQPRRSDFRGIGQAREPPSYLRSPDAPARTLFGDHREIPARASPLPRSDLHRAKQTPSSPSKLAFADVPVPMNGGGCKALPGSPSPLLRSDVRRTKQTRGCSSNLVCPDVPARGHGVEYREPLETTFPIRESAPPIRGKAPRCSSNPTLV